MATKRKPLSKKIRFEVLKRDKFTCQYCGAKAPDVVLEVDHIKPVSKGGTNDLLNLITSCYNCNHGKGAVELSDDSTVSKQQAQLQLLAEKKEQMDMLLQWKKELHNIENDAVEQIANFFSSLTGGVSVTETGKSNIRKWIKQFSFDTVLESTDVAVSQYFKSRDDAGLAFSKIPGICYYATNKDDHAHYFFYLRKVMRDNYTYIDEKKLRKIVYEYVNSDDAFEEVKRILKNNRCWSGFIYDIEGRFIYGDR